MTPPHDAVLGAHASKLGWMTATFVPTKKLSCALERCLSQGPFLRPWIGVVTSSSMDKCDRSMSRKPRWWQGSFFFANRDCSSGVHWFVFGAVVEPVMHVFMWDAKGSQLYMHPLIQQLRDKGIPLTAKALGF